FSQPDHADAMLWHSARLSMSSCPDLIRASNPKRLFDPDRHGMDCRVKPGNDESQGLRAAAPRAFGTALVAVGTKGHKHSFICSCPSAGAMLPAPRPTQRTDWP